MILLQDIEDTLNALLNETQLPQASLLQAARYSTLAPGKRLRPLITLEICQALGFDYQKALIPACALELVHTYTLIHDDLPCMDDEVERRGKPPLHHAFPEGHALLTGDFLLTYAFELLATAPHLSATTKLSLVRCLSQRSGARGVIAGQIIDLYFQPRDQKELHYMIERKTSDLFCAAFEFGAILGNAPKEEMQTLNQFGILFGLAFQFIDDMEDFKETYSDSPTEKMTAVTYLGFQQAILAVQEWMAQMHTLSKHFNKKIPFLIELIDKLNAKLSALPLERLQKQK